jgi:2-polyprenylphenol 6-hydroxylase
MIDVGILGGGPVGAAFALALKGSGLSAALVEPHPLDASGDAWDSRIYAISPGNAAWLRALGAWERMRPERVAQVLAMHIYGDDGQSRLIFDALEEGVPELAHIAENSEITVSIWQALQEAAHVRIVADRPKALVREDDGMHVLLESGEEFPVRLLVGADGAHSWVRRQAGMAVNQRGYGQKGVVANFACEQPHGDIARQWFRDDGVLAWLPMPGKRFSIVWSAFDAKADELMALSREAFTAAVEDAGGTALGSLTLITPPAAFPLAILTVDSTVRPRLVLIGDAAHRVHPLAGQGVNLGLEDARNLAEVLARRGSRDAGDPYLLRRHELARKEAVTSMQWVTEGLYRLFGTRDPLLRLARNWGLDLTQNLPAIKHFLVRQAMQ